ncbi:MFS transporter [Orrella daihaiensis]|uniref:MFS transporter n=1 Tax=Orrella daihaiensis TaxID=2782176 RepID=A0ABY4AMW0_9BURK|nr:MFS transporter [Orrella daihaiensis]UOD50720.1 MFS transporter [Orrella daihaiensis]
MTQAKPRALAPFSVRSFRFQWPADLAASWAFEIEMLILGWYVLVESESVFLLVLYGALQYIGALASPYVGVLGDRFGYKSLFVSMRVMFVLLSIVLLGLAIADLLNPVVVILLSIVSGILKPSDVMIRFTLIAQTLDPKQLVGALGISRLTVDSARMAGAIAGVGIFTLFGMVGTYILILTMYVISLSLSFGVAGRDAASIAAKAPTSVMQDLKLGIQYVWHNPALKGCFMLAFWVNVFAYPLALGLLPYVVNNVFEAKETLLGVLGAAYAFGSLLGSILMSSNRIAMGAGRLMILAGIGWFAGGVVFAVNDMVIIGVVLLVVVGAMQSLCVTPLAAVMLRATEPQYRGRVMGMRILAILGLPLGLMLSGPLIDWFGFAWTWGLYSATGVACAASMIWVWRDSLWQKTCLANSPSQAQPR